MNTENGSESGETNREGAAFFRQRKEARVAPGERKWPAAITPAALILGNPNEGREFRRQLAAFDAAVQGQKVVEFDPKRADR